MGYPTQATDSHLGEYFVTIGHPALSDHVPVRSRQGGTYSQIVPAETIDVPSINLHSFVLRKARDMYYACLAKELTSAHPSTRIKVLNYAPGPLETDMVEEIRAASALDESLKPSFAQRVLEPLDSARVLVKLIQEDGFESGSHVDYYDVAK